MDFLRVVLPSINLRNFDISFTNKRAVVQEQKTDYFPSWKCYFLNAGLTCFHVLGIKVVKNHVVTLFYSTT